MAKGGQVRRPLRKGFTKIRQSGSHITFRVGEHRTAIYAFHDTRDLGEKHLRMIAKDFGLTIEELKELLWHGSHERAGAGPGALSVRLESQSWAFHVDEPRIVGGGQATLDEARQAAAEAIAYALAGQPAPDQGDQVEYLDVAVG